MASTKKKFCVVTTEHRGVFGGYMNGDDPNAKVVTITDAQMCVYWAADVQGVVGLAVTGPSKSCKITPAAPKITLQGVTSIMEATADAEKAWKERPWR